jgi:hydroxymethylpyrimidine pyrophosphatase-like HAD family hydrolase
VRFAALACDYDGTLASADGIGNPPRMLQEYVIYACQERDPAPGVP